MNKPEEGVYTEHMDEFTDTDDQPANSGEGIKFYQGCFNGCLFEIVAASVIGLLIALAMGLPEIVAWMRAL